MSPAGIHPILGIAIVLVALGVIFGGTHAVVRAGGLRGEWSRKVIHGGMGAVCATFPLLFRDPWPVDVLAIIAVVALYALRRAGARAGNLAGVLHCVGRSSVGELLFPIGVALVFRMAQGDVVAYVVPVLVLTFGDAAGALVGKRFGKHTYLTNTGVKSIEGSLAVFVASFAVTASVLIVAGRMPTGEALIVALLVGIIGSLSEGILAAGADNLVLPLTVFALLQALAHVGFTGLSGRVVAIVGLLCVVWAARKFTSLDGGGLLAAVLFGYLCYALGGPAYLLAPLVLFAFHLYSTVRLRRSEPLAHGADAVAWVGVAGLSWIAAGRSGMVSMDVAYAGFSLSLAAHLAMMHVATQMHLGTTPIGVLGGSVKAFVLLLLAGAGAGYPMAFWLVGGIVCASCLWPLSLLFACTRGEAWGRNDWTPWLRQTVFAAGFSMAAAFVSDYFGRRLP